MLRFTRRAAIAALSVFALSACGQAGSENSGAPSTSTGSSNTAAVQDIILGDPEAPVTLIEYASWTCPACLNFDETVMPMIKTDYVDTGKVRFVFREFPTAPVNISVAGFAIARCAGEDQYYPVLEELFDRQAGILALVRQGGLVREALMQVAENHGISGEEAFEACLADEGVIRAISTSVNRGDASGVDSTPTLFVNGERLEGYDWRFPEGMKSVLDGAYIRATGTPEEIEAFERGEEISQQLDELNAEADQLLESINQDAEDLAEAVEDLEAARAAQEEAREALYGPSGEPSE